MPMIYAKCSHCGTEAREIVPINKDGYVKQPNGSWRFDPNAKPAEPKAQNIKCPKCGKFNEGSDDPAAVRSYVRINFMED